MLSRFSNEGGAQPPSSGRSRLFSRLAVDFDQREGGPAVIDGGMFVRRPAAPALAGRVDFLWSLSDSPAHPHEWVTPSGTLELVVNLHEDRFCIEGRAFAGAMVSGAYARPFLIETQAHTNIMGVHFRPGGAQPFFGAPPGALAGLHVELAALWGRARTRTLRERLGEEASLARRFDLLEAELVARMHGDLRAEVSLALAALQLPRARVEHVVADSGLSHRRLAELFTAQVGMRPKAFARVLRFCRARDDASRTPAPDWGALAVAHGYFDQSHLIRDFMAFAGVSPSELVRRRDPRVKADHLAERSTSSNTRSVGSD